MLLYQVPLWYPHAHNLRIAHTHACTIIIESNISILFKRIQLDFKYKKLIWLLLYMVFSRVTASKTNIKFIKVVCLIKNGKKCVTKSWLCALRIFHQRLRIFPHSLSHKVHQIMHQNVLWTKFILSVIFASWIFLGLQNLCKELSY